MRKLLESHQNNFSFILGGSMQLGLLTIIFSFGTDLRAWHVWEIDDKRYFSFDILGDEIQALIPIPSGSKRVLYPRYLPYDTFD